MKCSTLVDNPRRCNGRELLQVNVVSTEKVKVTSIYEGYIMFIIGSDKVNG